MKKLESKKLNPNTRPIEPKTLKPDAKLNFMKLETQKMEPNNPKVIINPKP
jgi:hypothetical protein